MKSHVGGPIILTKYVESNKSGCDKSKPDTLPKVQAQLFNQFLAYMYLDNANKAKYGKKFNGSSYANIIKKTSNNHQSTQCFE
jgi:hypothetical protein